MVAFLALLTVLVSSADHWTTYLCLTNPVAGWTVSEVNPISAWMFEVIGVGPALWLDSAVTIVGVGFLATTRVLPDSVKVPLLAAVFGVTAYAVANNLDGVWELGLMLTGGRV